MFKRGSKLPFRMWAQEVMWNQSLEPPWKTGVQSPNTPLTPELDYLSHFHFWAHHFPIKSPHLLFDHLLIVYTNQSQIITLKGSLVQLHRNTSEFWCLEQLIEVHLTLQHQEVPASVVFWTLSPQLLQASPWASRFLYSAAGTKDFKRLTEVPYPEITARNMKWSGKRKGDRKDWVWKGVQEADPK